MGSPPLRRPGRSTVPFPVGMVVGGLAGAVLDVVDGEERAVVGAAEAHVVLAGEVEA